MRRLIPAGLLAWIAATPVAAQAPRFGAGAMVMGVKVQNPAAGDAFTGSGGGLELGVAYRGVTLRLRYAEVPLDSLGPRARTMIEGEGILSARVTPWLTLGGGPHARTFVIGDDRVRRVQWEVRARARAAIIPRSAWTFLELWAAPWTDINLPGGYRRGLGGTGGLSLIIPKTPVHARIGYRVDSGLLARTRRETVEEFSVSAGIGLAHF